MKKESYYFKKHNRVISQEGNCIRVFKAKYAGDSNPPISETPSMRLLQNLIDFTEMENDIWKYDDNLSSDIYTYVLKTSGLKIVCSEDGYFKIGLNDMIVKSHSFHRLDVGERDSFLDFIKKLLLE